MKVFISLSASKAAVSDLEKLMLRAADVYYNEGRHLKTNIAERYPSAYKYLAQHFDISGKVQTIDDATFDAFTEFLKEQVPNSPVLKQIRAPAARGKAPKVKLKHWMGSLDKKKPDTVDDWLAKHKGPYVVSNKMDGTSLQINYDSGVLKIFKGGDGAIGQDVSHLIPHLRLPKASSIKGVLDVRAEVIMSQDKFDKHWAKDAPQPKSKKGYENARNLASGVLNKNEVHESIGDIDVVCYEIMDSNMLPSLQFALLHKLGFHVAPNKLYGELSGAQLTKILSLRNAKSGHEIDGLVVTQDKKATVQEGSNPTHSIAFKVVGEGNVVKAVVKDVVWEVSKNNLLKPRINIEPTRLQGITIKFATGHNAYFIQHGYRYQEYAKAKKLGITLPERPIGPGAVINITRSGEVIPHVVEVVKSVRKPSMPNAEYVIQGPEAVLVGESDLGEQKRITHFFSTLKVDGVKLGTVTKLFDSGIDTILKIVKADVEDILDVEGFQQRSATSLVKNIKTALDKATLPQLMDASGAFGTGMGTKNLTAAVKHYPELLDMVKLKHNNLTAYMAIPGFSEIRADQLVKGLPKFLQFYKQLGIKVKAPAVKKPTGSKMKAQNVVFTGYRDAALEAEIESQGGVIGSGVSKTTTILVYAPGKTSSKLSKADQLGILSLTPTEFKKKYRLGEYHG